MVLVVVTIGKGCKDVTANLAAPIVINSRALTGLQVVLQDPQYATKHPLVEHTEDKSTSAVETNAMAKVA